MSVRAAIIAGGVALLALGFAAAPAGAVTVTYSGSELVVSGDNGLDDLFMSDVDASGTTVEIRGNTPVTAPPSDCFGGALSTICDVSAVTGITVNLAGGADKFRTGAAAGPTARPVSLPLTVNGGDGNDLMFVQGDLNNVGGGPVSIDAGDGNDVMIAPDQHDTIDMGAGDDQYLPLPGAADDVTGGSGFDGIFYLRFPAPVTATLGAGGIADDVEKLVGTNAGGDHLNGNNLPNTLISLGAPSVLDGRGGDDAITGPLGSTVFGGAGDDTVLPQGVPAGAAGGTIDGGTHGPLGDTVSFASMPAGFDVSLDGVANDGRAGDTMNVVNTENVTGTPFADRLTGGAGDDRLAGGGSNDVLVGGLGADDLDGGAGIDRVDYSSSASAVTVTLDDQPFDGATGEGDNVHLSVENVTGSPFGDILRSPIADTTANILDGGGGDDTIDGGGGADELDGAAGADHLRGEDGSDLLVAGDGTDDLEGGAGDDQLLGGNGDDHLDGGDGGDQLLGGTGLDTVDYSLRSAAVHVSPDAALTADDGEAGEGDAVDATVERVLGGNNNDVLTGTPGADELVGNAGNDTLDGGAGPDVLDGGTGDDTLASVDAEIDQDRCGDGTDIANVDAIDLLDHCESVTVGAPSGGGPGGGGSGSGGGGAGAGGGGSGSTGGGSGSGGGAAGATAGTGGATGAGGTGASGAPLTSFAVSLSAATITASANGTVSVVIACPSAAAGGCQGFIALATANGLPVSVIARVRRQIVALGRAAFDLPAGASKPVTVRLSPKGRRALKKLGHLRMRVTVTPRDAKSGLQPATRLVTLRARHR